MFYSQHYDCHYSCCISCCTHLKFHTSSCCGLFHILRIFVFYDIYLQHDQNYCIWSSVKLQSHTMKSIKALQQSEKRACLCHWIGHTALKRFNELQSYCAKNGSDRFCCNDQSHCNETCEVFDCKVIETRPQVSYFY